MSCTVLSTRRAKAYLCLALVCTLSACGGGGGGSSAPPPASAQSVDLQGGVFDGPVVGATVTVLDADGQQIATTTADNQARYRVSVPGDAPRPWSVVASGGTDLVTGRALDFELAGSVVEANAQTVNLTPISTLAVRSAACAGGVSRATLDTAMQRVRERLSMGLDPDEVADPQATPVTADNIATVVLANEAVGETLRRATRALAGSGGTLDADAVLEQVACDLSDGELDGSGAQVDARTTVTFRAAQVAVALETIAGRLEVDGQDATALMNDAISNVMSDAAGTSVVGAVEVAAIAEEAADAAVSLDDETLSGVAVVLADTDNLVQRVDSYLTPAAQNNVAAVQDNLALADTSTISSLRTRMNDRRGATPPVVSLSASASDVDAGGTVSLSWAVSGAERCVASGAWNGRKDLEGVERIRDIDSSGRYKLTCTGLGGTAVDRVVVNVNGAAPVAERPTPQPAPAPAPSTPAPGGNGGSTGGGSSNPPSNPPSNPTPDSSPNQPVPGPAPEPDNNDNSDDVLPPIATISASSRSVARGETVIVRWISSNAEDCYASGGWNGKLALTTGRRTIREMAETTTYQVTCTGPGGSAVASVTVRVEAEEGRGLRVQWAAPEENEDGTLVTDLDGYRIHYGPRAGEYNRVEEVLDPRATSHTVNFAPGTYYVAMTAVNLAGEESGYSNAVRTTVD